MSSYPIARDNNSELENKPDRKDVQRIRNKAPSYVVQTVMAAADKHFTVITPVKADKLP